MQQDEKTKIYQNTQCHFHIMVELILHSHCIWEQMTAWFSQSLVQQAIVTSKEKQITSGITLLNLPCDWLLYERIGHNKNSDGHRDDAIRRKWKHVLIKKKTSHSVSQRSRIRADFPEIHDDGCYSSSAWLSVMRSLLPTAASERNDHRLSVGSLDQSLAPATTMKHSSHRVLSISMRVDGDHARGTVGMTKQRWVRHWLLCRENFPRPSEEKHSDLLWPLAPRWRVVEILCNDTIQRLERKVVALPATTAFAALWGTVEKQ